MSTEALLAERGKTHGDYSEHARCTQAIMRALQAERNWETLPDIMKETCHMIAHKLGRVVTGNEYVKDHWDDICGYSLLVAQRVEDKVGLRSTEAQPEPEPDAPGGHPDSLTIPLVPRWDHMFVDPAMKSPEQIAEEGPTPLPGSAVVHVRLSPSDLGKHFRTRGDAVVSINSYKFSSVKDPWSYQSTTGRVYSPQGRVNWDLDPMQNHQDDLVERLID